MRIVLEELGYDPNNHRSQNISENLLSWADKIICMGNVHVKHIVEHYPEYSQKVNNWLIDDPHFATGTDKHREVARQIQNQIYIQFA